LTAARRNAIAALPAVFRYLTLAAIAALLPSCALLTRPPAAPEVFPEERRPAQELVQSLGERAAALKSLRTLASVYYSGPDARQSFQEVVLVQRPDRVRLETLSPLGALLILTATGDELAGFHTREGVFYRGKSSPLNLYRFTQIPLSVGELTAVLMGLPPAAGEAEWKNEGPSIIREVRGGWKETITFDPSRPLPIRWQRLNPEGKVEMSARFSDFTTTPAGPFPLKIVLEAPTQQRRLEITYKEPELNVGLDAALFVQQKPENAREVPLDSLGG
jgi:outer membrane lipoprotein-sorting protein